MIQNMESTPQMAELSIKMNNLQAIGMCLNQE